MRIVWLVILTGALAACGNSGGNNGDNNDGTNGDNGDNGVSAGECTTDDDCPGASDATFANPDNVVCASSLARPSYCSECVNDGQCERGYVCRDVTYCEELPPCDVGADCASDASEVHLACVDGFCDQCGDDFDCEDDEVCYSKQCATRTTVDPTCLEATCEGPCEIQYATSGAATGIACME